MSDKLPDVQKSTEGFYKKPLKKVGVRGIVVPLVLETRDSDELFNAVCTVSGYCNVPKDVKGMHMSRVGRTINEVLREKSDSRAVFNRLDKLAERLREASEAKVGYIKAKFDYLYRDKTPISKIESYEPLRVEMEGVSAAVGERNYLTVCSVVTALCPCSKSMSSLFENLTEDERLDLQQLDDSTREKIMKAGFGAHSQKSVVEVKVELNNEIVWIEDLADLIGRSASSRAWSVLKRVDEKYVTEVAYMGGYYDEDKNFVEVTTGGAAFVEDVARCAAQELDGLLELGSILDYSVVVNNQESIHSGDVAATAVVTADKDLR